jgi:cell division protein FtsB
MTLLGKLEEYVAQLESIINQLRQENQILKTQMENINNSKAKNEK